MILKKKRVWIPAAAAAAVAAGLALSGVLPGGGASSGPSSIPSKAPSDADTLVVAPATGEWWEKVTPLMKPTSGLSALDLDYADLDVEYIGYSRSVNHAQVGDPVYQSLRTFYVEAADEDSAQAVAEWLSTAEGSQNRMVETSDDVVLVSSYSDGEYKLPERSMADVMGSEVAPAGSALMFKAPDAEGPVVTGSADSDGSQALSALYTKTLGLEPGTTWMGTSRDGLVWKGGYKTGGASADRLDFKGLHDQLESYAEVAYEEKDERGMVQIFMDSPADIAMSVFAASPNAQGSYGGMPQGTFKEPALARDEVSTLNMMPRFAAAAAGEAQGEDEDLISLGMSTGSKEMVVTLGFEGEKR